MKRFLLTLAALALLACSLLPAPCSAQDITPQILQIEADVGVLAAANTANVTQQNLVLTDSGIVTQAQAALVIAQSGAQGTTAALTAAEIQLQADVTTLTEMQRLHPKAGSVPSRAALASENAHLARAVLAGMSDDPNFVLRPLDDLRDIAAGVRQYRLKQITGDQLGAIVNANHKTLTPNPNRICTIITLYNLAIPFIEMFQPGVVLPPMPLPPQCLPPTPAPTPTKARRALLPLRHVTSAA